MTADPFSNVLALANAQSVVTGGFTASGRWAIGFPPPAKIKFFGMVRGACWLRVDGEDAPLRIEAGDVFLLAAERSFVLAGDLSSTPVPATSLFRTGDGAIVKLSDAEDDFLIGGHVQLDPASGGLLAHVLPPLIHVRAALPQATILQWLLDQLVRERRGDLPGASLASSQLAQLMFVQVLRAHLAEPGPVQSGWLRAINDPRIAPALRLMHGDPGHPWQLGELAKAAAMSRTTFALHFKSITGISPLAYLTEWRIRLAERALREENTPVSVLAQSLGYTSESAFSNAFKRATGRAPKHYRSAVRANLSAPRSSRAS
jgi:AraC-like DNA-binding protein